MQAVIFRIPNDNFKDLYAETFQTEDELYEWIIKASDIEIVSVLDVEKIDELENIMIDRLDNSNPLWEMQGIDYWINRFSTL